MFFSNTEEPSVVCLAIGYYCYDINPMLEIIFAKTLEGAVDEALAIVQLYERETRRLMPVRRRTRERILRRLRATGDYDESVQKGMFARLRRVCIHNN